MRLRFIARAAIVSIFLLISFGSLAEMVNINKADAKALVENLPGIGDAKAKAIVQYRKKNGGFKSIDELMNVPGIGEKTFAKLKTEISVNKGATRATGKKPITSTDQITSNNSKTKSATSSKTKNNSKKITSTKNTKNSSGNSSSNKDVSKTVNEKSKTTSKNKTSKTSTSKTASKDKKETKKKKEKTSN